MKIEIIESKKNFLKFKMLNQKHTIPELLKVTLLEDKDIVMASYLLDHPEDDFIVFEVRTEKNDPKEAIFKAISTIKKDLDAFEKGAKIAEKK